jgi:hypothetical protein
MEGKMAMIFITRGVKRTAYESSVGKPEGKRKRPLRRTKCRGEDNVNMVLKELAD